MAKQKLKHIKRMDNSSHIPDFVQAFSYIENGGINLVLKLTKPLTCIIVDKSLTCMIVASNSIILTTMCEQN